jgi:hypothetical protein
MIAEKKQNSNGDAGTTSVSSSDQLPNSKKIYVAGKLHSDIRVPLFVMSSPASAGRHLLLFLKLYEQA